MLPERLSSVGALASGWPLVGRDAELERIVAVLAGRQRPVGAVLAGAAGVGKTRLATEVLARVAAGGRPVRWAAATHASSGIPFGAVAGWLPPMSRQPDPAVLLAAAAESVTRGASDAETSLAPAVGVDDAHLLDSLSAALVHRLAVSGLVRLVVTVRSGEPAPDAVTALWKDGLLERVDLGQLDAGAVAELLEAVLEGPVEAHTVQRLIALSAGSVFFLREIVEGELATGNLRRDRAAEQPSSVWRWRGDLLVRPSVVEVVGARLRDLPEQACEACELLAFGEPLPLDLLDRLVGREAVALAEQHGLVELEGARRLVARLAHPLYGEALRANISTLRARALRTRLLRALQAAEPAGPADGVATVQRAVLLLDSDADPDPGVLTAGASVANSLFDFPLGTRLARAAVDAGGGFPASMNLAYALTLMGRVKEGDEALAPVLASPASDEELVAAAALRISSLFWPQNRPDDAEAELDAVCGVVPPGQTRLDLDALRACFAFFRAQPDRAIDLAAAVIATGTSHYATAWAAAATAISHAMAGRCERALEFVKLGEEAAMHLEQVRFVRLSIGNGELFALGLAGRLAEAEANARKYQQLFDGAPGGEISACSSFFCGQAAYWRGALPDAVRHLREAISIFADYDPAEWSDQCRIVLAQSLANLGDVVAARAVVAELQRPHRHMYEAFRPLAGLAHAWVGASEGALSDAVERATTAAAAARDAGQPAIEALALHTVVRWAAGVSDGAEIGQIAQVAARLAELADQVEGRRTPLAAEHAAALAAADGVALDRVTHGWEAMGALAIAADAAAQAAVAHRDRGSTAAALASSAHAHALARQVGGARTPALLHVLGAMPAAPLTRREREVATMAAAGMTNASIAERLVLSVRTVEGHLYQAYAKLGVHGRAELGPALGLRPPDQGA